MSHSGLKRTGGDCFYTQRDRIPPLLQTLQDILALEEIIPDLYVEPSAGDGVFLDFLPSNTLALDLDPKDPRVKRQDYLTWEPDPPLREQVTVVIGNPPFGRQSCLARKFIAKSCEYARVIAFILPKSFKKESLQRSFAPCFHLVHSHDLPPDSFRLDNVTWDVPCVYQVWVKRSHPRQMVEKSDPVGFRFVTKDQDPDLSFRRVGFRAGLLSRDIDNKSPSSHYFLVIEDRERILDLLEEFERIEWDHNNTVGPRSISKKELIEKLNEILLV